MPRNVRQAANASHSADDYVDRVQQVGADGTVVGGAGTTVGNVGLAPRTGGGLVPYKLISAATTNATSVKASAGQVYGYYISNVNAAARYVKLYDKASAPTVGTDVPKWTLMIPAGSAANCDITNGLEFTLGIALAITVGVADADVAAVAANELVVNLAYK